MGSSILYPIIQPPGCEKLTRFALATARKELFFMVGLIHFFGVYIRATVLTLILFSCVLTMLCPVFHWHFYYHTLYKGPSTYLCIIPFSFFTLGLKDNSNTRAALATVLPYFAHMEMLSSITKH